MCLSFAIISSNPIACSLTRYRFLWIDRRTMDAVRFLPKNTSPYELRYTHRCTRYHQRETETALRLI